jgi:hypothetical protein
VPNSSLELNIISPELRDKSENTLYISLLKSRVLGNKAFSYYIRGRGLNNILNYRSSKAYSLPDLAIAFLLLVKEANSSTNRSSLVLIRLVLFKNI